MKTEEYPAHFKPLRPESARSRAESSGKPKSVLILETNHTGHHLRYVSLISEAFRSVGLEVILASTQTAFQSTEYAALMQNCDTHIKKLQIPRMFKSGALSDVEHIYRLLLWIARGEADLYFVPFLGTIYSKFGVLGAVLSLLRIKLPPVWGIMLAWPFAYFTARTNGQGPWRERLWRTVLRHGPFQKVFLVDEIAFDHASKQCDSERLLFSPEPIDCTPIGDRLACRRGLGIPETAKVIGAFGCLRRSRGVQYLLEAFLQRGTRQNQFLLFMGPQDNEIKNDFAQILGRYPQNPNLVMVEKFLTEAELQEAFVAVDIVAVPYPNFCSTPTMLIRAAAAGKPVLGANDGWIGRIMSKYRLGVTCDVRDVPSVRAALDQALGVPGLDCPDARALAERYDCERFSAAIVASLR